jgi:hypothetical protein
VARTRDWRRWKRDVKMMRRLKEDWNQHYGNLSCPCRVDPKFRSIVANTPQRCSEWCCGNNRRYGKGQDKLRLRERRAVLPVDEGAGISD